MKLDRLLGITMELLTKKRVTATELASRFEVSIRTIYRDIELINQSGIPVASFSGTDGGFEIMDGFFLSKQHFSIDDFSVIYSLLEGMEGAVGGKTFTSLVNKLSSLQPALLDEGLQKKIVFDMSTSEAEKEVLPSLLAAIDQSRRIAFTYINASGQVSERKMEPLNLLWEKGTWYLDGYCLLRKDNRLFRCSRMTKLEVFDETFSPRSESKSPIHAPEQGTNVHLRFDLTAQPRVFEQFPGEYIFHGDFVDVQTIFYSKEYALSVILSYGTMVEILSPDELKQDLIDKLKEIRKIYF
ncbi:YafY family transcriptional regulator [Salicibibacter cibarius]|uniref:YafY family transcriptional regulator n=1 Tax=Salicibibacter cibarius TaxID=2743000 RepID=A0A7T6Z1Y0_9BACI|nr:YafY family protein [Salicibibacter cibarius]QQK75444.1 YafY family transcriptional regulator [Salicibibacter cibarius]